MSKISVIIKRPGEKAHRTNISSTLENLQKTVGGYIETVTISSDSCFICNENGRLLGLPYNFSFTGVDFVGTVILIGVKGDEFADIPISFKDAKRLFPSMFEEG